MTRGHAYQEKPDRLPVWETMRLRHMLRKVSVQGTQSAGSSRQSIEGVVFSLLIARLRP